jgi:hypothetical protein
MSCGQPNSSGNSIMRSCAFKRSIGHLPGGGGSRLDATP